MLPWITRLWSALLVLILQSQWKHLGTRGSVTSYVTTTTSVRLISASSLISAIFHFKCLQALGQRQPEAGAAISDNISSHKHTYPKFKSVCILKLQHQRILHAACFDWALFIYDISPFFSELTLLLLIVVLAALSARLRSCVIRGTDAIVGIN